MPATALMTFLRDGFMSSLASSMGMPWRVGGGIRRSPEREDATTGSALDVRLEPPAAARGRIPGQAVLDSAPGLTSDREETDHMARSKRPSLRGRRAFLEQAAWLPLAAAAGVSLGGQSTAAAAPIKRAGGAHLKTALNAYSFADLLTANLKDRSKGLDLFQLCDYCAEQGFEAVDLTGYFFPAIPGCRKTATSTLSSATRSTAASPSAAPVCATISPRPTRR